MLFAVLTSLVYVISLHAVPPLPTSTSYHLSRSSFPPKLIIDYLLDSIPPEHHSNHPEPVCEFLPPCRMKKRGLLGLENSLRLSPSTRNQLSQVLDQFDALPIPSSTWLFSYPAVMTSEICNTLSGRFISQSRLYCSSPTTSIQCKAVQVNLNCESSPALVQVASSSTRNVRDVNMLTPPVVPLSQMAMACMNNDYEERRGQDGSSHSALLRGRAGQGNRAFVRVLVLLVLATLYGHSVG